MISQTHTVPRIGRQVSCHGHSSHQGPHPFQNFFSKRSFKGNPLKRTKSVTKLERKRYPVDVDG